MVREEGIYEVACKGMLTLHFAELLPRPVVDIAAPLRHQRHL